MLHVTQQWALAKQLAGHLGRIPGVRAVTLGGSLARGRGGPGSDVDIGIYYRAEDAPDIGAFRVLAREVDDRGSDDTVSDYGGWGSWVDGGAWLKVGGRSVDWIYRDLDRVERVAERCEAGHPERELHGGHPHGFHSPIYLGEVVYSRVLYDPAEELARLKARLAAYPPKLKAALTATSLREAAFALAVSEKSVKRAESAYVAGCFFECVYDLVQVLFALNERYFVNEKGAVAETRTFKVCPSGFVDEVTDVLATVGRTPGELRANHERLRGLLEQVKALSCRGP